MTSNFRFLFIIAIMLCAYLFAAEHSYAQDSVNSDIDLQTRAVNLVKKIQAIDVNSEVNDIKPLETLELPTLRSYILAAFDGRDRYDFNLLLDRHATLAQERNSSADIVLANYYRSFYDEFKLTFGMDHSDGEQALALLEPALDNEDWIIAHQAHVLSAVIHGHMRNFPQSLKLAANSLALIPTGTSDDIKYAQAYSYGVTSYLHAFLKNPELAVSATEDTIDIAVSLGERVNPQGQINNLIYAFMGVRDHETALKLIEILLEMEGGDGSATSGLTQLRAAQVYINLDQYDDGLRYAQQGITVVENAVILRNLRIAEIQALAGGNSLELAEAKLATLRVELSTDDLSSNYVKRELTRADALIAAAQGDARTAVSLMERYNDLSVRRILDSNNNSTANLLANLENDKIAREQRAEMERLRREALESQLEVSRYILVIIGFLLIAAVIALLFSRYRGKNAQRLARAAEAALAGERAKSQFLAVISHELRTPLNGIIGIADLLSRTTPDPDLRHKISIINDSGHDLLKLVEQVLDMSRIDAKEMEIFPEYTDLTTVIESLDSLWRPTIEKKGVIFTSHVEGSVPSRVMVDPLRLRQCVNNLLSNAAKFTSSGRVHLHVTATPIPGTDDATISVIVADTGIGMSETVKDNLFKPFVQADSSITRQYGGSGLGLAITRSLARMMDGDLSVTTRAGAGTEFTLTLRTATVSDQDISDSVTEAFTDLDNPAVSTSDIEVELESVAKARDNYSADVDVGLDAILGLYPHTSPATPDSNTQDIAINAPTFDEPSLNELIIDAPPAATTAQSADEQEMDSLQNLRVLIVEDVPSNQDVMRIFLEPQGCLVMSTANGKEALDALSQQVFDVILMDIRMPEMDGIQATKIIRERGGQNTDIPIIALTADATAENNADCMAAGADIFLTKPLIATELYEAIRFTRRQALRRATKSGKAYPEAAVRVQSDRRAS